MKTPCGASVNNTARPLWAEINNPFSITSRAYRAVSDYIRNTVQWQNLLSGQIPVSLWFAFCPYYGLPGGCCCCFERQPAWQACWDAKSWSEGAFPKAFQGLHLILVAGIVALAPKSFFTVLRASLSPWISVCKMGLAMVCTFEGALWWGWERVWVQIQHFPEASVLFGLNELQKPQCYLLTKHRIWRREGFYYWWSLGFC